MKNEMFLVQELEARFEMEVIPTATVSPDGFCCGQYTGCGEEQ